MISLKNIMKFFYTLPEPYKEMAFDIRANELLDSWVEEYIHQTGVELPSYVEESLLELLGTITKIDYISQAKKFYNEKYEIYCDKNE